MATGTTLALGGATIGTNALAVTGTVNVSSSLAASSLSAASNVAFGGNLAATQNTSGLFLGASDDTILTRHCAACFQLGAADAAAPVAQTLGVQSVVAGTSNTAGQPWILAGSLSTGSGASGDIIVKTGGTGAGATVQNSEVAALTIKGATQLVQLNSSSYVSCGSLSTNGSGVLGCGAGPAPLTTGGSGSLTGAYGYWICTTACSIALPAPVAGNQFCVRNDSAVTTVITISAIASVQFEKTTYNGYGAVTTGTMVSGGALGDKICLIGRDATHYLVGSFVGTWTNS